MKLKGKIEIVCDDKGTHLSVQVQWGNTADRVFLVHALGKALALDATDYLVLAHAEAEGLLEGKGASAIVEIDRSELLKQLEEEQV